MNALSRIVCAFVCAASAWNAAAQDATDRFAERLSALTPARPVEYYLLGEEVADAAAGPEDVMLARRLFVLAYSLGAQPDAPPWLRASACIALASLERDASRRRWLIAVASILDDRYADVASREEPLAEFPRATRLAFAEYLGLVRAGRGVLARQRLEEPGMNDLLDAIDAVVIGAKNAPSLARIRGEAGVWPCKQCGNARAVPDASDPETRVMLCPNCRGNPGPLLSDNDRLGYVALEAIALRADGRTWSAEHAMLRTGPLLDPDPERVPTLFQIDPTKSVYNSGAWITPTPGS